MIQRAINGINSATMPTVIHLVTVSIRVEGWGWGIGPYPGLGAAGPAGHCGG
jgi:hypothetical protein